MHDDLTNLITKMKMLEDTTVEEVVVNIEETPVHPLIRAMQELREVGIIESVDPNTIFNQVKEIHRDFRDIEEGDLPDRIYWFDEYKTTRLPLSQLDLDEFGIDDRLVDEYIELIKASPNTMPPIVFDPIAGSIIDGAHRANAYAKLGYDTIPAYVGLTKSDTYGEREEIDEEIAYHGTTDDIAEFRPLTHFGTEKAAKDRMTYKKIKDGKIYKVDLDIKNPLTIKDFPGIHYDRLYAFELRRLKLISQEEMEAITFIEDPEELRKALLAKLKDLGIDGFVYKNRYEDKGNLSYVIVDPRQVKVLSVEPAAEELAESSPDTLEGSFTPDLVESKEWLCEKLAKGLKGKNAGTIYVLGSWYGNMGIFLQQAGIKYDKLVLVEPDEEAIERSKKLLDPLNDDGKIVFISQKAEDVVYEKPGIVINTSCNETGPVFLTKLPDNMLCLLQARNNNDNTLFPTEHEEDFVDYFPLQTVYYTGKKYLEDPEINYVRYMIIGRSGKKQSENTDTNITNESLSNVYPYKRLKNGSYTFSTNRNREYEVYFQYINDNWVEVAFDLVTAYQQTGSITGTGDAFKVLGTVVKIVQDYVSKHSPNVLTFSADGDSPSRIKLYDKLATYADKALPNYTRSNKDWAMYGGDISYVIVKNGYEL